MLTLAAAETLLGDAGVTNTVTCTVFGMELNASVESYKVLYQGRLPTSTGTLYTAPTSTETLIKTITLANTSATDVTLRMWIGGSSASNRIVSLGIPANGFAVLGEDGWRVFDALGNQVVRIAYLKNTQGFRYWFKTSTSITDPAIGGFSFNHATITSATHLCLHKTSLDSAALSALFALMLAGKSAVIIILDVLSGALITVRTTAMVDNGTWVDLTCTVTANSLSPGTSTDYYVNLMSSETYAAGPGSGLATFLRLAYKFSTTLTVADPTANFYRVSNADIAANADSFTMVISDTDNNSVSQKTALNALIASDNKSYTTVSISTGPTDVVGMLARVDAVSVQSGYTQLTCTFLTGIAGSMPANNTAMSLQFKTVPAAMADLPPMHMTGNYSYGVPGFTPLVQKNNTMQTGQAQLHLIPFQLKHPTRIRNIVWNVGVIGGTNLNGKLAIYRAGGLIGSLPRLGAKVFELTTVSGMFGTAGQASQVANQNLPAGNYWLVCATPNMTGSPAMKALFGHYNDGLNIYSDATTATNTMGFATKWHIVGDYTTTMPAEGTAITVTYTNMPSTIDAITPIGWYLQMWPLV